jgi:Cu/Ag efflux pump CusA
MEPSLTVIANEHNVTLAAPADRLRPVRIWLYSIAALVLLMVVVGGATRLTESGLSITSWKPIAGMLPLALGTGPGAEERRAVAVVVIGGQVLCLLLTLVCTPVAYTLLEDLAARLRWRGRSVAIKP